MLQVMNYHRTKSDDLRKAVERIEASLKREPTSRTKEKTDRIAYLKEEGAKHDKFYDTCRAHRAFEREARA